MEPRAPLPEPTAEVLFADFLEHLESADAVDFDAFCLAHPQRAEALRRVHTRWLAMTQAFEQLSQDGAAGTPEAASKSVDELKGRLATAAGRLARYTLRQEIARGAMGRIVCAWDEELRREVALKIHRGDVGDTRLQRRFLEEAQIAAQLDHPGIVAIHELGLDPEGRPFFAMQLVRGRDLGQILAAAGRGEQGWSRTRVLGVLLRVCEAMAFAHDKGVVHRDLKPANIMVGRFGETYVMDWGLAHVRGAAELAPGSVPAAAVHSLRADIAAEDTGSALLTHQGEVVGTPAYMAPEQAIRGSRATPAVDVYAVGAILHHLLAGEMPYAAASRSADDLLRALRAGPPAPLPVDVPPELRAICERAMARDAAARYADMAELADDLRAYLEVRTVGAYATGRFAELRKWIARNRTLTAVAGALALALVVGAVAVTTLWFRAVEDRARADASTVRLQTELDRSAFEGARQALQLDNSTQAATALWSAHLLGRMPRATAWALKELAARDPYLVAVPEREDRPVAFTIRGDGILVGGSDGRLQLRDPSTLAMRATIGEPGPKLTALAPLDDSHVVAGSSRGDVVLFDLAVPCVVRRSRPHTAAVASLAALPGGGFVSAAADGQVLRWRQFDGEPELVYSQKAKLTSMVVRPNGDGVVVGDDAGTLSGMAFDHSWQFERVLQTGIITALAFADGPDHLWVGDNDHQVRLIDFVDRSKGWIRATRNGTCRQLARARDGSLIVGGWWRTDRMAADGSSFATIALRPISRLALDADGRRLVTTSTRSGLGVVDLDPTWRRVIPSAGASGLSGDGRCVATSVGNKATVRDVASGEVRRELPKGSSGWLTLDRDGSHLASCKLETGTIRVYEVASGSLLYSQPGPIAGSGFAARFSPTGDELAFAVGADRVRRVHPGDGSLVADYSLPGARIIALGWSADGHWLAVAARGRNAVRVYEVATGQYRDEDLASAWPANVPATISAVALSPDGRTVAVGNSTGPIVVRGPGGATMQLDGHAGTVWSLQFAGNDPGLLFSTGGAQGVACWDLDSGECCYQAIRDQASQMEVSEDGRTLSCITPAGAVLLDLAYHDRYIAGNLSLQLDALLATAGPTAERIAALRAWAADVLSQPWPRWQ